MAKHDSSEPLRIHVLGMDDKAFATFGLFLQGPCKGRAVAVDEPSAEVTLIDLDGLNAFQWLARERERFPDRPLIVSSLRRPDLAGTLYLSKPINALGMLAAIEETRCVLLGSASRFEQLPKKSVRETPENDRGEAVRETESAIREKMLGMRRDTRRSTHQTAMLLDERTYSTYVGVVPDIDIHDPLQVAKAHYDKRKYWQAYVESAVKLARTRQRILQLNCGWQPMIIFPRSNESWVDADDRQTRAFCVVPINSILDLDLVGTDACQRSIIAPVSPDRINADRDPRRFQSIDAFVWKIALWTSNGRVPDGIALDQPVYLERWPNLTRFVIVPHALRIAALLIERPMALLDVAKTLEIRQQYVFSFFSAAMALGIAGQSREQPKLAVPNPVCADPPRGGLLKKILNRLRVG